MPNWLQHLLVVLLVAGCVLLVAKQCIATLRGRKSAIGKCCSKGCEPMGNSTTATSNVQQATSKQRIHFMPAEMLTRRK